MSLVSQDREDDDDDDGSAICGSAERSAGHIRKLLSSLSNDDDSDDMDGCCGDDDSDDMDGCCDDDDSDDMDGCCGDDETDECGVDVCDGEYSLKVDDKLKLDSDVSSDSQNIGTSDMKPYTF